MGTIRWLLFVVVSGFMIGAGSLALFFKKTPFSSTELIASTSNTYLGPKKPVVGDPQLVRVQVLIRDAVESGGVQILNAEFNGESIPLQPRDVYGNRASASFQIPPGKYKLRWKVNRDRFAWPRTVTHEEEVMVSPRDLWLQITIDGNDASIR